MPVAREYGAFKARIPGRPCLQPSFCLADLWKLWKVTLHYALGPLAGAWPCLFSHLVVPVDSVECLWTWFLCPSLTGLPRTLTCVVKC